MLENLFGNSVIEKILFFLLKNEKTYASQLSQVFEIPLFSFQTALNRLEKGGVVVSHMVGRTRLYQFNPRYALLKELKIFLDKAYTFLPEDFQRRYYESPIRKRPRRKGKPL
jgi:DNA-binding transcriptional ArsR family regulator